MTQEFIHYEQSVALKELGFNEPCFGLFVSMNNELLIKEMPNQQESEQYFGGILAPTYSQVFRFFREKYKLHSNIISTNMWTTFSFYIDDMPNKNPIATHLDFNTYEEAELACLIRLIEIVKNK
jgi:hypothetical protein